jgi:hypothetical protein
MPQQARWLKNARTFMMAAYPPHEILMMPALSPTMEEGTIASWDIQPGEEISALRRKR